MGILEVAKSKKKPLSLSYIQHRQPGPLSGKETEESSDVKYQQALAVVLPRLLKPTTVGSSKQHRETRKSSTPEGKGSFGSWLGKFGSFFGSRKTKDERNKKPLSILVDSSHMKEFCCLLGKHVIFVDDSL